MLKRLALVTVKNDLAAIAAVSSANLEALGRPRLVDDPVALMTPRLVRSGAVRPDRESIADTCNERPHFPISALHRHDKKYDTLYLLFEAFNKVKIEG